MAPRTKAAWGARVANDWSKTKTDTRPHGFRAKIEIREHVLDAMLSAAKPARGQPKPPPPAVHVLDAFCGSGEMHKAVWHRATSCMGIDKVWFRDPKRLQFVADNQVVLRSVDLSRWNLFDFDSYGSPWTLVYLLGKRRPVAPGERIGLVLTEGSNLRLSMNGVPAGIAVLGGLVKGTTHGVAWHDTLFDRLIENTGKLMRARLIKRWEAKSLSKARVRYIGLIFEGERHPG